MRSLLSVLIFVFSCEAWAFNSPFAPTFPGTTIGNAHAVDREGYLVRGMEPRSKVAELIDMDVQRILVFKNETRSEVRKQKEKLVELGYSLSQIKEIPFRWKDFESFDSACLQTVEGLLYLEEARAARERVYFHCTVGEDRTGHLAGLFRLLDEPDMTIDQVFQDELCQRGYARANPRKPRFVVDHIRKNLSVLFFEMAEEIREKKINIRNLKSKSRELCSRAWNKDRQVQTCRPLF